VILFSPTGRVFLAPSEDALAEQLTDEERIECPRCHLAVLEDEFSPTKELCIYCVLEVEGWGAGPRFPAPAPLSQKELHTMTNTPVSTGLIESLNTQFDDIYAAMRAAEYAGPEEVDLLLLDLRRRLSDLQRAAVEALGGKATADPDRQIIVVHNAWCVCGVDEDGKEVETPLATLGRPQDWGDPRWHYNRFRFDWMLPEAHYINHVHIWTDLKRLASEYPQMLSGLIASILIPGLPPELAGREMLDVDDLWCKEWGPTPPVWDGEAEFENEETRRE